MIAGNKRDKRISLKLIILAVLIASLFIFLYNILLIYPQATHQEEVRPVVTQQFTRERMEACQRMKSVRDIQLCHHPSLVRPINCSTVEVWEEVQRCLTGRFFSESDIGNQEPFTIHIVGERHSGTKFLQRELQQCFLQPSATKYVRKVHRDFIRVKHFFQPIQWGNYRRSIVVVIVRDPLEWVAAMHEMPYHAPGHVKAMFAESVGGGEREVEPLPWQEFVKRPWTIHRSEEDNKLELLKQDHPEQKVDCQEDFEYREVVPCRMDNESYAIPPERYRAMRPLYELRRDGSGTPYRHILELRSDKIVNMVLQLPMLFSLGGFMVVRYEDLLRRGSYFLLKNIATMVGMDEIPLECQPSKPQPERLRQRYIPNGLQKWVEENLDTQREKLIGYRQ